MRKTTFFVLVLLPSGACLGGAQEKSPTERPESSQDLAAIRAGSEAFMAAFNKQDAKAVAALWTDDGEYIDDSGRRFAGRDAIEKGYTQFFADNPNVKIRLAIDSLRQVSPNTAIEDGRAVVEPAPAGADGVSQYTAVHTKVGGKWLMASVRDTWIETSAEVRTSADLEFLIGTWVAEEHGVQTVSDCRWVADGRFIERRYTTTLLDGTKTSGVQMIGWNPQGGHVQSWDFSPDGGHAVGLWSPIDGGWQAKVQGTTGEGISTAAVNRLMRLDDNAYVWQSVQRSLGDVALPDTDEVVIKRRPAQ
jgi:uncharacterized protein (TIGR02246 family)